MCVCVCGGGGGCVRYLFTLVFWLHFAAGEADVDLQILQNNVHSGILPQSGQSFPGSNYSAAIQVRFLYFTLLTVSLLEFILIRLSLFHSVYCKALRLTSTLTN